MVITADFVEGRVHNSLDRVKRIQHGFCLVQVFACTLGILQT